MATNLQFIKQVSGTSVSTLDITNCFSDKYDVYKIFMTKVDVSQVVNFRTRLIKSDDSLDSTAKYDSAVQVLRSYTAISEQRHTGQTYWRYTGSSQSASTFAGASVEITIYNPFDSASYTFLKNNSAGFLEGSGIYAPHGIGVHKVAQSNTGFQMLLSAGTYDNITVNVYGVK